MNKFELKKLSQKDIKSKNIEVVVIPIGATEPHNYHLPYGTDFIHVEYIAKESCRIATEKGANILLLPTIPFGVDSNMFGFPFVINVYQKTLNLFLKDIIDSIEKNNVQKIVIINGHGGNDFKPFLRDLMPSDLFVSVIDWWKVALDEYTNIFEYKDDHAGEMETSVMLKIAPDLVQLKDADEGYFRKGMFDGINKGWVMIARKWDKLTHSSGVGYPLKATQEKGEKYLKITIDRIANYLIELSKTEIKGYFPFVD